MSVTKGTLYEIWTWSPFDRKRKNTPSVMPLLEVDGVFYNIYIGRKPYNIGSKHSGKVNVNQELVKTRRKVTIDNYRHKQPANFIEPKVKTNAGQKSKPRKPKNDSVKDSTLQGKEASGDTSPTTEG